MATETATETRTEAPTLPQSSTLKVTQSSSAISSSDAVQDTKSKSVPIHLQIFSDNICPFCYLGYRKIQAAMKQAKDQGYPIDFSLEFKPFLLDPTLPCDKSFSKRERYAEKFGDKVDTIFRSMQERGKQWGIDFSFGGKISNTFTSHRLLDQAYRQGGQDMQCALIEKLFAGYFENDKDLGDKEWLAEEAVEAGLFETDEEGKEFLESDENKGDVCSQVYKAQSLGITGVPFTVINDKYAVSGAQEPEAFMDIFKKIACGECPCKKA